MAKVKEINTKKIIEKPIITVKDLGGYHPNSDESKWPVGSIFENEGKRLYDLVRKEKPLLIVEIGGFVGCSTSWMAKAIRDNKKGKIISIDNNAHAGKWSLIPKELKQFVAFAVNDCFSCKVPEDIDILFEDGMHTYGFTQKVLERFPAKIVVCHDYMHWDCQNTVKPEFDKIFGAPDEVFFEKPSDCGLAIKWVK
ncbi:MAG: class I SAM-dependent methyltransferase [Bacteroidetes bacterium]|nr:class I SAM-dependent methyltransferase [Bacteroidota bacterium]